MYTPARMHTPARMYTPARMQLQMTSVLDENVHCIAVQGTFDDCQVRLGFRV